MRTNVPVLLLYECSPWYTYTKRTGATRATTGGPIRLHLHAFIATVRMFPVYECCPCTNGLNLQVSNYLTTKTEGSDNFNYPRACTNQINY